MNKQNIVLFGFMGTGKTVTGRLLAERTGMELVDMDAVIEQREGRSISAIFAQDGELAFRVMEHDLTQELAQRDRLIISTGGGVVLHADNLIDFRKSGLLICLTASPETIFRRLEKDATRPLLSGDMKEQITALLKERKPFYDTIVHQIDGDQLTPKEQAEMILNLYALESEAFVGRNQKDKP